MGCVYHYRLASPSTLLGLTRLFVSLVLALSACALRASDVNEAGLMAGRRHPSGQRALCDSVSLRCLPGHCARLRLAALQTSLTSATALKKAMSSIWAPVADSKALLSRNLLT